VFEGVLIVDSSRVSQLSSIFGAQRTRRDTIKYAGIGLGIAGLGAHAFTKSAAAQQATPTAEPDNLGLPQGERTYYMFVQTARSGAWAPKAGEDGVYTLTLTGLPAQTVYFSDRPERIVGTQTTVDFLKALGFSADNPPNAALVTSNQGEDDVLVIELFNAVYTEGEEGATLVYDARILDNYFDTRLGNVAKEQNDLTIPATFDGASLFIDDCADGNAQCFDNQQHFLGNASFGCCYQFPICKQCGDLSGVCNNVPGCANGACSVNFTKNCFD
jgi:hypothetical protein